MRTTDTPDQAPTGGYGPPIRPEPSKPEPKGHGSSGIRTGPDGRAETTTHKPGPAHADMADIGMIYRDAFKRPPLAKADQTVAEVLALQAADAERMLRMVK